MRIVLLNRILIHFVTKLLLTFYDVGDVSDHHKVKNVLAAAFVLNVIHVTLCNVFPGKPFFCVPTWIVFFGNLFKLNLKIQGFFIDLFKLVFIFWIELFHGDPAIWSPLILLIKVFFTHRLLILRLMDGRLRVCFS